MNVQQSIAPSFAHDTVRRDLAAIRAATTKALALLAGKTAESSRRSHVALEAMNTPSPEILPTYLKPPSLP